MSAVGGARFDIRYFAPRLLHYLRMSDEAQFTCVYYAQDCVADIVFVHGLTGSPQDTWQQNGEPSTFWPNWFAEEFPNISVYTLGYPASLFVKWAKKEMDMFERAGNVLEAFVGQGIGARPLIFIAHSLGGILTKIILRKSCDSTDEDWKAISERTRLVTYLSTPHTGAILAKALDVLPLTSSHIKLLANETGFLEDLNSHYRSFAETSSHLTTVVYYEKHTTKKIAVVVNRDSADPGVVRCALVPVDKDHLDICKPGSREDTIYLGIRRRIEKIQQSTKDGVTANLGDDYSDKASLDRRDLLKKLIDAEREHEYDYANDSQNKFSRQYYKTGLLTAARKDHDNLLAEIQTRFVTHVYHPLICKGASEEQVASALQAHVIDPITNTTIGESEFSAKSVLNGLYFLTEQCHVRWDKPS